MELDHFHSNQTLNIFGENPEKKRKILKYFEIFFNIRKFGVFSQFSNTHRAKSIYTEKLRFEEHNKALEINLEQRKQASNLVKQKPKWKTKDNGLFSKQQKAGSQAKTRNRVVK